MGGKKGQIGEKNRRSRRGTEGTCLPMANVQRRPTWAAENTLLREQMTQRRWRKGKAEMRKADGRRVAKVPALMEMKTKNNLCRPSPSMTWSSKLSAQALYYAQPMYASSLSLFLSCSLPLSYLSLKFLSSPSPFYLSLPLSHFYLFPLSLFLSLSSFSLYFYFSSLSSPSSPPPTPTPPSPSLPLSLARAPFSLPYSNLPPFLRVPASHPARL